MATLFDHYIIFNYIFHMQLIFPVLLINFEELGLCISFYRLILGVLFIDFEELCLYWVSCEETLLNGFVLPLP